MSNGRRMGVVKGLTPKQIDAFMNGEIALWAQTVAENGGILSDDDLVLAGMFHRARIQTAVIPLALRKESRAWLAENDMLPEEDVPLDPREKLTKRKAKIHAGRDYKKMLKDHPDAHVFIILCPTEAIRISEFSRAMNELSGQLDGVMSNVNDSWLVTLGQVKQGKQKEIHAQRLRFVTELDDITLHPDVTYVWKEIFDAT